MSESTVASSVSPASTGVADVMVRLQALAAASEAASGCLDDSLVTRARDVVARGGSRLRLSANHTVVALAGATGSGKSSTFNALTGLELSAVGPRRPTTSWATACVWGAEGASELLTWLGIPDRYQTTRDSMLDTRREGNELDGVVLLDLPDHDSTEISHHLEVDRLVTLADLMIWIVDPQKYADAAIHDRYLEPLRTHSEVMVVVLNHIDEVPEGQRDDMLADLKRLLAADGLPQVPVLAISAKLGWGVDELRSLIAAKVADKKMTKGRIDADVKAVAAQLDAATGTAPAAVLIPAQINAFDAAVAGAAGVPAVVDGFVRSVRRRAMQATGWPVASWMSRLGDDPAALPERESPTATSLPHAAVETAARSFAASAAQGVAPAWQKAFVDAATSHLDQTATGVAAALSSADLGRPQLPSWVNTTRVVQRVLLAAAVVCLVWAGVRVSGSALHQLGSWVLPAVLMVVFLAAGFVGSLIARSAVSSVVDECAAEAEQRLRGAVSSVTRELVVAPLEAEMATYTATKQELAVALRP